MSALKGPLHGGAPGPVIEMLDEIGEAGNARAWLEAALQRGDRLMGFGHRIYRVRDPRADALKRAIRKLDPNSGRLAYAEAVEAAALAILRERKPARSLQTNVEFYTALLLEALAFPRRVSPASSRWAASSAGSPMRRSSSREDGSSARNRPISAPSRGRLLEERGGRLLPLLPSREKVSRRSRDG